MCMSASVCKLERTELWWPKFRRQTFTCVLTVSHGKHFAVFENTLCHVFRPHGKKAVSGSVIISTRYTVDIELPEMSSDQIGETNWNSIAAELWSKSSAPASQWSTESTLARASHRVCDLRTPRRPRNQEVMSCTSRQRPWRYAIHDQRRRVRLGRSWRLAQVAVFI
jgi:hypothetical protein